MYYQRFPRVNIIVREPQKYRRFLLFGERRRQSVRSVHIVDLARKYLSQSCPDNSYDVHVCSPFLTVSAALG